MLTRGTDIDAPLAPAAGAGAAAEPSPEVVEMLTAMGFTSAQAKKALRETVSILDAAAHHAHTNLCNPGRRR